MKISTILLSILFCTSVQAGEYVVHLYTNQIGPNYVTYEKFTLGFAYTNDKNYRFGIFRNKYKNTSLYFLKSLPVVNNRLSLNIGISSNNPGYYFIRGAGYRLGGLRPKVEMELNITKNILVNFAKKSISLNLKF